jgi:hypothetical protein
MRAYLNQLTTLSPATICVLILKAAVITALFSGLVFTWCILGN